MEFAQAMTKRDDAKCYRKSNGAIIPAPDYTPCPAVDDSNACCGTGHQCMPVSQGVHMCYSPTNNTDYQSYYVGGCTDSTYKSASCDQSCANEPHGAVVWNNNNWACCSVSSGLGGNHIDCSTTRETFSGPSKQFYDDYRNDLGDVKHGAKIAAGVIAGIAIACVVGAALCCFLVWRCCFSRHARERKSRGKFMPLGRTKGTEDVWDANMHTQGNELHEGPPGSYGYGGQGAPYNPPHQQGPQYTVANFR